MNAPQSWNEFVVKMPVKASVKAIYDAWTTSRGIESWFLRSATYTKPDGSTRGPAEPIRKGDVYLWLWHGFGDDAFENRPVFEANSTDFIQFEFSAGCVVSVTMHPQGEITMVVLKQEKIPDDTNPATNLFVGCQLGWTFYLTNLKSILEGGIDLRNKDVHLKGVANA